VREVISQRLPRGSGPARGAAAPEMSHHESCGDDAGKAVHRDDARQARATPVVLVRGRVGDVDHERLATARMTR
jgi:hypothetical protein